LYSKIDKRSAAIGQDGMGFWVKIGKLVAN
jgi:hypothetical protein